MHTMRMQFKESKRSLAILLSFVLAFGGFFGASPYAANAEPDPISTDARISPGAYKVELAGTGELDGASVIINDYQPGDSLSFDAGATGITVESTGNGVYILKGRADVADYQTVLQSAVFSTTAGGAHERSVTFSLGSALPYSENGHYYEFIETTADISWHDARDEAEARSYFGLRGYLATITSPGENAFIAEKALGLGWIGAMDILRDPDGTGILEPASDAGDWRWVTGPEGMLNGGEGLQFYEGYTTGGKKVTDSVYGHGPDNEMYVNWDSGEPNDSTDEFVVHIFGPGPKSGKWNDYSPVQEVRGYVVEYGGMSDDNTSRDISATITIVDKAALEAKRGEILGEDLNPADYSPATWNKLQDELKHAQDVFEDPNATAAEVGEALQALQDARDGLLSQLSIISVTVEEGSPNQATLTFNQDVESALKAEDFAGLTIDGRAVTGATIDGDKVTVTFAEPFGPNDPLVVEYDADAGNIHAAGDESNELLTGIANEREDFEVHNNIVPLEIVTAYTTDGKLKLVFNKPIGEDVDLSGLTFGGAPVLEPYEIDGNELIVTLPEEYEGTELRFDPEQGGIAAADNPGNTLGELVLDLGEDGRYVNDNGRLADTGIGLAGGDAIYPLKPDFDAGKPGGYKAVVPNGTDSVRLSPVPQGADDDTVVKVSLNGQPVDNVNDLPLQEGVNTIKVGIYDKNNPNVLLGQYEITVIRASGKLVSLEPSTGELKPPFDPETNEYEMSVKSNVRTIAFTPTTLDPGATMTVAINDAAPVDVTSGQLSDELALRSGMNRIVFTVTDSTGEVTTYTVNVRRTSSGGSGGGGGGVPSGSTEIVEVDVVIGGDSAADLTKVPIERTTQADGTIVDRVTFTADKAQETVDKAIAAGETVARVVIPDPEDKVSEVRIDIPVETAKLLYDNGIELEIYTDNAIVRLPNSSLADIEEDFYFRLVPVKSADERSEIEERAVTEAVVREVAGDNRIEVVARPMTIETNLSSRPVTLVLPLKGVALPAGAAQRAAYLAQLGIFIEHSDGDKEVVSGEPVAFSGNMPGLQFSVTKFSTFTIIDFNNDEFDGLHEAYIIGYPDGEFKPNDNVTRGQIALMIARNLGYEANDGRTPFPDVAANHYAASAIAFVQAQGIVKGDPDGRFRADDAITRAEMAAIVANYRELAAEAGSEPSFGDTAGHWAKDVIEASLSAGIVQGYPDGTFRPNGHLTRAEAVAMINQMFERGPLYGTTASVFPDVRPGHWAYEHIQEAAQDHYYVLDEQQREQAVE